MDTALSRKLKSIDTNNDGVLDVHEVAAVVDEMLKEQQMGRIFKYMTIGLFIVVVVLIGALSGITWGIVQLSKDTKVTDNQGNYQFLVTKEDKPAITGGAVLDLTTSMAVLPAGANTSNMSIPLTSAGGSRRRLISLGDFNKDLLSPYGTVDFASIEEGCKILKSGVISFAVSTPGHTVADSTKQSIVTVVEQTGCDNPSSSELTALVTINGLNYVIFCQPEAGSVQCSVWLDLSGMQPTEAAASNRRQLQYGDLVLSRDRATGGIVHRPVYLFGHRTGDDFGSYVHITAAGRTLKATHKHFVPVCVQRCTAADVRSGTAVLEHRYAGDVRVGDNILVSDPTPALAVVSAVDVMLARGFFNPYIRGADLIVDGVVASPHSNWILDSIMPASMVKYLPAIYEAMLAPVYGIYLTVGPYTSEWLAHGLGLAEGAAESGLVYLAVVAAASAPVVAALALGGAASKRRLSSARRVA
ncbi:hypothetical protein GPECTOR_117g366 [Gonium pectorale]|uniref:EF-hand domain-containing protein n=1 Tax=Gonium pectorale TaxID=33097 RepID=A0A150FYW7_GONPE|nr:hypothetical protein GPECTOR_117g366 [Gonium pectorale]|eukprot:KXZ42801.1 hypothetical protein GPECTOR_117g366 [Gonium pectorale]